jgi:hypothetical protein
LAATLPFPASNNPVSIGPAAGRSKVVDINAASAINIP